MLRHLTLRKMVHWFGSSPAASQSVTMSKGGLLDDTRVVVVTLVKACQSATK